ncbi:MAG: TVP38/TMEM64 family protein [Casimicrobiaceae bacterium]
MLAVTVLVLAVRGSAFSHLFVDWLRARDIDDVAQSIRNAGRWGVAVSIGLMVVHSFIPFPAEVVAIANGIVYGIVYGTLITWSGAMLGAQAAFWIARYLGEPFVARHVGDDLRARMDRWIAGNGAKALLTLRLVPVVAFNLINYVAGLANVRWWLFTWTTAVGILPLAVLMVAAGDRIKDLSPWWAFAVIVGALALWLAFRVVRKRGLGSKRDGSAPGPR